MLDMMCLYLAGIGAYLHVTQPVLTRRMTRLLVTPAAISPAEEWLSREEGMARRRRWYNRPSRHRREISKAAVAYYRIADREPRHRADIHRARRMRILDAGTYVYHKSPC